MKIENMKTADLIPYARNAKLHSEAQVASIAGSIKEFGFNNPVLIDKDNGIIAGHGRVLAAQKLKLETVPCIRLGHLNENQRRAYIIADNRLAETGGGWDKELLKIELDEIDFTKFDKFSSNDFDFDLETLDSIPDFQNEDDLPDSEICGEDDRAGRFILVYENDAERIFWLDILGINRETKQVLITPDFRKDSLK